MVEAKRREYRTGRPTQGQGERLWATRGVLRLRTPRSWSHFPTSCSWPQGAPKSYERSKWRRIRGSAAATVPSSPFSAAQAGWGWIVSPRLFPASFPAGDHVLCVHSWKQKLVGCHPVKHQSSGLLPATQHRHRHEKLPHRGQSSKALEHFQSSIGCLWIGCLLCAPRPGNSNLSVHGMTLDLLSPPSQSHFLKKIKV